MRTTTRLLSVAAIVIAAAAASGHPASAHAVKDSPPRRKLPPPGDFVATHRQPLVSTPPGNRADVQGRKRRHSGDRHLPRHTPHQDHPGHQGHRHRRPRLHARTADRAHQRLVRPRHGRQRLVPRRGHRDPQPRWHGRQHRGQLADRRPRRPRRHLHARPPESRADRRAGILARPRRRHGSRSCAYTSPSTPPAPPRATRCSSRKPHRSSPASSTTSSTSAESAPSASRPSRAATSASNSSPSSADCPSRRETACACLAAAAGRRVRGLTRRRSLDAGANERYSCFARGGPALRAGAPLWSKVPRDRWRAVRRVLGPAVPGEGDHARGRCSACQSYAVQPTSRSQIRGRPVQQRPWAKTRFSTATRAHAETTPPVGGLLSRTRSCHLHRRGLARLCAVARREGGV